MMTPSMTICTRNCSNVGGGMTAEKLCFVDVVVDAAASLAVVVPTLLPLPLDVDVSVDALRHIRTFTSSTY